MGALIKTMIVSSIHVPKITNEKNQIRAPSPEPRAPTHE